MKHFNLSDTWISMPASTAILDFYEMHWDAIESNKLNPFEFPLHQNEALMLRLFLEQVCPPNSIGVVTSRIFERDFGSQKYFKQLWLDLSKNEDVEWLILGLSFADFKFHLFPIQSSNFNNPFSLSPILSCCFKKEIVALSEQTRETFSQIQWENINWSVVEQRISCLQEPLDIFGEITDCADIECKTF